MWHLRFENKTKKNNGGVCLACVRVSKLLMIDLYALMTRMMHGLMDHVRLFFLNFFIIVAPQKKISARHRLAIFIVVVLCLNLVRWSRHLVIDCGLLGNQMYWSCQRFAGKGLVVVREGISTPNAPYLR